MAEHYALPGQVVVGTDSHTPHSGALGCVAFGVGTTDMANAFVTGAVRMTMPAQLLVRLQGLLPLGVTAKDIVLHLLALPAIRAGGGVGKVFEFAGDVVAALSIDERATLTNMTAELGGFTGIVAPDAETVRFLKQRRGVDFTTAPWMHSDPDAAYAEVLTVDCGRLSPTVAAPGDPGNALPIDQLAQTHGVVKVSTTTTPCWPGAWPRGSRYRPRCSCICNTARRRCATTAGRRVTRPPSRPPERASSSHPAGPAPTADRVHRPSPAR
jgi:homoaconitase/3-isopropylmalate dehydratase large subunit